MLELLAEIYSTFPEVGDLDKPKLMLFIDEARPTLYFLRQLMHFWTRLR